MTISSAPYVSALLITAAICAFVASAVWKRREQPGAVPFTLLMGAVTWWSVCYAAQLLSRSQGLMIFWLKMMFVAVVNVPILWFLFGVQFAGFREHVTHRRLALLYVVPLFSLLVLWSNEVHGLFWQEVAPVERVLRTLVTSPGPWFWLHTAYSYLALIAGTYLILRIVLANSSRLYRRQVVALLAGLSAPWLANALYIFDLLPFGNRIDPTPFAFTVTGLALAWGLFRYRLLDVVPTARDTVFRSMSDGVIVLDAQNRIVDLNPAARDFLLRAHPALERLTGERIEDILSVWPDLLRRYQDVDELPMTTVPLPMQGRQRYIDLRISPVRNNQGQVTGRVVVSSDVTYRQQAEALQKEKEAAEAANQAKSAFMANMSHELRTPLNHIIGYAELLMEDMEAYGDDDYQADMQKIHGAAQHLLLAISHVLELSRLDAGMVELELMTFDPAALARDVVYQFQASKPGSGRDVVLDAAPELGLVHGDPEKTRAALANLLEGVFDLSSDGALRLQVAEEMHREGGWLSFRLLDSVPELKPADVESLFEPFAASDSRSGHSYVDGGLSLAICGRLCRLLGGEIIVSADEADTLLYTMCLPMRTDSEDVRRKVSENNSSR